MLYSAYRIKKESPDGPIFFKQKRVGLNGKEFVCVKFRSMIPDAEKGNPQFASKNDPRVFKWGETIRKTRIDELPQILNVLKGDMHFIGPRPERKVWTEQFEEQIPYYSERHLIKPGITGWAQVMYPYGVNTEDAKQKLMYDLYYIKHWSLLLEMKVLWKTIKVVLNKKGL
jgi:lipopolysaccharide/colanic/teichoic acid biosynthesis glycosyltransferase